MRSLVTYFACIGAVGLLAGGCAGPEQKLGRGLTNVAEPVRLGEMRRSMEQTALWDSPRWTYTTGVVRGFNRTVARTAYGAYEIATFPIPNPTGDYEAMFTPRGPLYPDPSVQTYTKPYGGLALQEYPVFPDSYEPGYPSSSTLATDTNVGFGGGDIAPMFPGSRFKIFRQ